MDRFHELNAFIAVVEAGGFTAAAHRTGDSQSAISKAIGALGGASAWCYLTEVRAA